MVIAIMATKILCYFYTLKRFVILIMYCKHVRFIRHGVPMVYFRKPSFGLIAVCLASKYQ